MPHELDELDLYWFAKELDMQEGDEELLAALYREDCVEVGESPAYSVTCVKVSQGQVDIQTFGFATEACAHRRSVVMERQGYRTRIDTR